MSRTGTNRLDWIEIGRALAALGVVVCHYDPFPHQGSLAFVRDLGPYGVQFFFCLSGFIIFYVHGHEFGQPPALGRYLWRRFARIFPTYWIVLIATLIFNQTLQNPSARLLLTPEALLRETFLWPNTDLLIGPGWTLRHELLFYAIFSLIILSRSIGLAAFLGWMTACAVNFIANGPPPALVSTPLSILLHHHNLDFGLGMAIAWATRRERITSFTAALAIVTAAVVVLRAAEPGGVVLQLLMLKLVFSLLLCGLVIVSRHGYQAPRWGIRLGAASYALYISHITIGIVVGGGLKHLHVHDAIPPVLLLSGQVLAAVIVSLLFFTYIEAPLLKRLYALWDRRARRRSSDAGTMVADEAV